MKTAEDIFKIAFLATQEEFPLLTVSMEDCKAYLKAWEETKMEKTLRSEDYKKLIFVISTRFYNAYRAPCRFFLGSYCGQLSAEKKKAQNPPSQVDKKKVPESKKEKISAPLTFPSGQLDFEF